MEKQFPKNVRQIGNVSDSPKIYVEDYVDTFLNQLCDKTEEEPQGAFLIGEKGMTDGQDCVYISGALKISDIKREGNKVDLPEETMEKAMKECKEYFGNKALLGWCLIFPGHAMAVDEQMASVHEKQFPEENSIFVIKDPKEKEELFFAYKYKDLMQINGHYVYYEKNPDMQNYMISTRKENKVTPSEPVADRAAKDFRNLVREKLEKPDQKQNNKVLYAASTLLLVVILVIGVTMVNNYDKIKAVQTSIEKLSASVAGEGTTKTDEKVTAGEEKNSVNEEDIQEAVGNAYDAEEGIYTVQKGDTLASISKKIYGDLSQVNAIKKMNGLSNGNLIYIGQKLLLP
nr:LysM peptidoglycan-binding domain-containing protein [uncultured Sellimonas sp.]